MDFWSRFSKLLAGSCLYGLLVGHPEAQPQAQLAFCSQQDGCWHCWGRKGNPSKPVASALSRHSWLHVLPGSWQQACKAIVCEGKMTRTWHSQSEAAQISPPVLLELLELFMLQNRYLYLFKYVADAEPSNSYKLR